MIIPKKRIREALEKVTDYDGTIDEEGVAEAVEELSDIYNPKKSIRTEADIIDDVINFIRSEMIAVIDKVKDRYFVPKDAKEDRYDDEVDEDVYEDEEIDDEDYEDEEIDDEDYADEEIDDEDYEDDEDDELEDIKRNLESKLRRHRKYRK